MCNQEDTQSGFHARHSITVQIVSLFDKILRNLGNMPKSLGSVAVVWYWWPPVTGRQVIIVFLLRNLCSCRRSEITTVSLWNHNRFTVESQPFHCEITTVSLWVLESDMCVFAASFHSLYGIDRHNWFDEGVTVGSCRIKHLLFVNDFLLLASCERGF